MSIKKKDWGIFLNIYTVKLAENVKTTRKKIHILVKNFF